MEPNRKKSIDMAMKQKETWIITFIMLMLLLFILANKTYLGDVISKQTSESKTVFTRELSRDLIFEETFEGSTYFPLEGDVLDKTHAIENCGTDWTMSTVTDPVFQGKKSVRFEIRRDQPLVGTAQRVRSEVTIIKADEDDRFTPEMWYSFSVLFPTKGLEFDERRDCINQWFEDGSRETTLRVEKNKAFLEVCPPEGVVKMKKYDLFSNESGMEEDFFSDIPKGEWHEFVFHFIHSKDANGLIEVWRDGIKIHEIHGRNMHLKYPKWKLGLYKSGFERSAPALYSRVLYFDNIRVGTSSASLADMTSKK